MAYVQPNSIIKLCRGCRNDPLYENTIYFEDESSQYTYFNSKAIRTFPANTYQRKNRGYLRLQIQFEEVYNCNYLMYQNTSFGSKWFYAFITSVEYINNNVVEIKFETDVLQTYLFDFFMGQCYVEREHASSDNIGDNLIPEPIGISDWRYSSPTVAPPFEGFVPMIYATVDRDLNDSVGTGGPVLNNNSKIIYTGLTHFAFLTIGAIQAWLGSAVSANKIDAVKAIVLCPIGYAYFRPAGETYEQSAYGYKYDWNIPKDTSWTYTYGGKQGPRNNKLYTEQFNKLLITDHNGSDGEFAYERFSASDYATFSIYKSVDAPNLEFACVPNSYKGSAKFGGGELISSGYPLCGWSNDVYDMWLAQNKIRVVWGDYSGMFSNSGNQVASAGVQAAGSVASENPIGVASGVSSSSLNLLDSFTRDLGNIATIKSLPPQSKNVGNNNANYVADLMGFHYYNVRAIDQILAYADDFFDMYGYATCRVKVPNRNARETWTYTKTRGAICLPLSGKSVPADDARKIQQIYDNGIRWWVNGDRIGNYSFSNNPRA